MVSDPPIYYAPGCRTVAGIHKEVIKKSGRNGLSRLLHAKSGEGAISGWKEELNKILAVFNVRSLCYVRSPLTFLSLDPAECEQ